MFCSASLLRRYQRALVWGTLLLSCAGGSAARGAEIVHFEVGERKGFIVVRGLIEAPDGERFGQIAKAYDQAVVLFESPGGALLEGLAIGETLRAKRFTSGVAPGTLCASACALAWLGGYSRYMSSQSKIGFHAAFTGAGATKQISSIGNALVGAYAQRMGLSLDAIGLLVGAGPDDVDFLTPDRARKTGIQLHLLEVSGPGNRDEQSPADRASPAYFVTRLDPKGDNWLALKAGPSLTAARLAKLPPDTPLQIIGRSEPWFNVSLRDGRRGWVHSYYVSCCRR